MNSYGYDVIAYGDTNLNVGDVVKFSLREAGTAKAKDFSMYSGYFFISNLQHTVDRAKFSTTMTLVKDSPDMIHAKENG